MLRRTSTPWVTTLALLLASTNAIAQTTAQADAEDALKVEQARAQGEREKAEADRKKLEAKIAFATAKQNSKYVCKNKADCDKAFSLTQIFINENADMKIQTATDTIIETHSPAEKKMISLKAIKMPKSGSSAEIILGGYCRADGYEWYIERCSEKLLSVYLEYPKYMRSSMR